jgi:hypothetical protein
MKYILTESQYNKVILEYYDPERYYDKEVIVSRLKRGPKYMHKYIKTLDSIPCSDGNIEKICTKIPQVVYQFLFDRF